MTVYHLQATRLLALARRVMSIDGMTRMPVSAAPSVRRFTEAARKAALLARAAKRAGPDTFGLPELFVVRADSQTFTWELRRFGGVLLERGIETFSSQVLARADGAAVLATLCTAADLPKFKRGRQ